MNAISKWFLPAVAVLSIALPARATERNIDRNIIWKVVSDCLDMSAEDYCTRCSHPRTDSVCVSCGNTTEVWNETAQFVAVRDRKMCQCPEGFVHGLAIPRARITGFEDPQRPDGIWKFAWETGLKRLKDNEMALAVNPRSGRSQDQLHVHIVRVVRSALPKNGAQLSLVDSLDEVWYAAARKAAELKWKDYGVLVTRGEKGKYLVVIDDKSPEFLYTVAQCGGPPTM